VGGLVYSMDQHSHIKLPRRGTRSDPMMDSQLHCLDGFRFSDENQKHNKQRQVPDHSPGLMCRGSNVKDKLVTAFQLESLILAQNERWRQA
jgi:hypothetical protein